MKKEWHSNEWKVRKREVRRSLRQFKKGKTRREVYLEKRKEFRQWSNEEKEKHAAKEELKLSTIKTKVEA